MLGNLLRTFYDCIIFIRHFILWNLRSFRHPRTLLFEYIINVHKPREETIENIHSIFDLFRLYSSQEGTKSSKNRLNCTGVSSRALNHNVLRILAQCPDGEDILQVFDEDGYNLLQKAVISNDIQLVCALLKKGCDVNKGHCSPPLHLACKLGYINIVKLLLKHNARIDKEAGMCYPKPHTIVNQGHSKFFFIDRNVYDCETGKKKPMLFAIDHDNLELVKVIRTFNKQAKNQKPPLHYACSQGAYDCINYFIEKCPQDLNRSDEYGYTPLLYSTQWGYKYTNALLNKGASISCRSPSRETPLHMLFAKGKMPDSSYETAKLLLGSGLEDSINIQDLNGNTALHNLVALVKYHVTDDLDNLQEWDNKNRHQILKCIDLLLQYNSDSLLVNKEGLSPIHVLLTTFYEKIHINPETDNQYILLAFDILYDVLKVFLANKMDPDIPSPGGRTPLMILLPQVLHIDHSTLRLCCESIIRCLQLLCDYGADPNFSMATESSCISLLSQFAAQVIRMRSHSTLDILRHIKKANAAHLQNILILLLRNGLNPNFTSNRRRPQMEPGSGNGLVEFVKLAQNVTEPKDFSLIHMWILTMLQWGGNPDIQPFPSETIICQSQSNIFLKHNCTQAVNHYMLEIQDFNSWLDGDHAEELLMLFVNSMDHLALYQCLGSTKFMSRFNPNRQPSRKFNKMIHMLNSNPRSLKQISRVAILKAMDRKVVGKVEKLPLPKMLKDYVSELHSY